MTTDIVMVKIGRSSHKDRYLFRIIRTGSDGSYEIGTFSQSELQNLKRQIEVAQALYPIKET